MISYLPKCCLWCESTRDIIDTWALCRKCHQEIFVDTYIESSTKTPFSVSSFKSTFQFFGNLRKMILKWKYNPSPELTRPLGTAAITTWGLDQINFDLIIPVPPYIDRLKERKIHQTLLIAKWVSRWIQKPIFYGLHRSKETHSQTALSRRERFLNIANAFRVEKPNSLKNKHILIIDDLMTTGATLKSVISSLKSSSPAGIHVRTLAFQMDTMHSSDSCDLRKNENLNSFSF